MPDPTFNLSGIEIMRTGKANGTEITAQDLADMANAFSELDYKPPLKSGHSKDKPGMPALGWIDNLVAKGKSLFADFSHMPKQVYDAIRSRSYDTVSAEVFYNLERGGKTYRRALKALSLLGADIPAIAGLKPLHEMFDAEHDKYEHFEFSLTIDKEDNQMPDPVKKKGSDDTLEALKAEVKTLSEKLTAKTLENDALQKEKDDAQNALEKKLVLLELDNRATKIKAKVAELKIPALREHVSVFYDLAMQSEKTVKFALGDGKTEELTGEAVVDKMVADLNQAAAKLFAEQSTTDGDHRESGSYDNVGDEVDAKVMEYCQKNSKDYTKDYREALTAVLSSDADLKTRYATDQAA